jgi:FG-GAP repeat/RTX calcium-binding nonapeptide repeat (4 copies)
MKIRQDSYRAHVARCLMGAALLANLPVMAGAAEFASVIELSALDGTTGFQINGELAGDRSGNALSAAGDVNGDGFGDVIIGVSNADPHGTGSGSSYVVFGNAGGFPPVIGLSSLNGTTGFQLNGEQDGDYSGLSVSAAGDVNGDGFDDVIVGAFAAAPHGATSGASYVVFGKAQGFQSVIELSALDGVTGFQISGEAASYSTGRAVASAGDINSDGFDDMIIGAPSASPHGSNTGASYVVFGKAQNFTSVIEVSALNGATGFQINGEAAGNKSGASVSSAGDMNGDGFGDVIIGAPEAGPNGNGSGASYVLFGKAQGFNSVIELSALNGARGFQISGVAENHNSGRSVAAAGDVNGDGFGDVIIGAYLASPNGSYSGSSYVVFGKAKSFKSVVELSALNGTNGFKLNGEAVEDYSGYTVGSAGDMNGDGFSDVIVGAHGADANGSYTGASFVVFGKAGGFAPNFNLSALNGKNGFQLNGEVEGDRSGRPVALAGDVNGDGLSDVFVGADNVDTNGALSGDGQGASYVVFGRAPTAKVTRAGAAAAQYISGGPKADTLKGKRGNDVLEGRGGGDKLQGDDGKDTASYAHAAGPVTANLASPSKNSGQAKGDRYQSIANLEGSGFDDSLTGDGNGNRLTGGKGGDKLKGGSGKDTIVYRLAIESPPGTRDTVIGFNPGTTSSAVDKISLAAMDANTEANGNQAFTFMGTATFNGPGQVRLQVSGSNVVVQGNTGGSTAPEFEIVLKGIAGKIGKVTAKDFKL